MRSQNKSDNSPLQVDNAREQNLSRYVKTSMQEETHRQETYRTIGRDIDRDRGRGAEADEESERDREKARERGRQRERRRKRERTRLIQSIAHTIHRDRNIQTDKERRTHRKHREVQGETQRHRTAQNNAVTHSSF